MTEKETAREPQTKERISSREIKQKGRGVLKKHYLLLVIVCIVLGVLKGDLGISTEKQDEGITISTRDEEEQAEVRSENKSVTGSTGVLTSGMTASDVMLSCLTDGVEEGSQLAKAIRDSQIEAATDPALGRTRGVLHGPWIPIYGTGCILVLVLLKKLRGNPVLHFFATVLLCGCVEYFTGYFLEMTHGGQKWWDYSGYYLNLQGRVCFEGLLVFGIGGCLVIYLIAPIVDQMLSAVPVKVLAPVVAVLMCVFMVDNVYSSRHPNMGEGVTDIAMLEESPGEVSRMA